MNKIPFNTPFLTGKEVDYINDAYANGQLAGDGKYTKLSSDLLQSLMQVKGCLLTHSCTAALEMAAILLDIKSGDEVIMPSYTFVSTANAFVLRGAVPVFVDVDPITFNIAPSLVSDAITSSTRAIVAVHYAGVSCDMDHLMDVASCHHLPVVEDAAQAILSTYKGKKLGSFGSLSALSFHETKNVISGEGGALLFNDSTLLSRGEIIREKGTNRSSFFRGEVDKYTWVDIGSSFLPGELIAAFLYAQLQDSVEITTNRLKVWSLYHQAFRPLEEEGLLERPFVPKEVKHNAHMYFLILESFEQRSDFIRYLNSEGIGSVFHYVPLHTSPAGKHFGRACGTFSGTLKAAERLVRLPMGCEVNYEKVIGVVYNFFGRRYS